MARKQSRSGKKSYSRRTVKTKSKPRPKRNALPIAAFKKSIGKKFQIKEQETHVETDKKSKASKRREGL